MGRGLAGRENTITMRARDEGRVFGWLPHWAGRKDAVIMWYFEGYLGSVLLTAHAADAFKCSSRHSDSGGQQERGLVRTASENR